MNQKEKDWKEVLHQEVGRALRNKMPPIVFISHDYNHKFFPDEFITIDSFSDTKPIITQ